MIRLVCLGVFLTGVMALAQEPEPREKKVYKTPRAVFDAALAAQNRKDYKTMVACIEPEARGEMAAGYALAALNIKEGNTDELRKAFKPLFDVLDKHGLTEKATKDIRTGDDPRTVEKSRLALRKMIKNHARFAVEYLTAQEKIGAGERPGESKIKLEDVKIKGDRATGTMVIDFGGSRDIRNPIEFVKIKGSWLMIPEPRPEAKGKDRKR